LKENFLCIFVEIKLEEYKMEKRIIITIGRQFGSGGRVIGLKLAEALGLSFYDKELIRLAAEESGLCTEVFEKVDEKAAGNGLLSQTFAMGVPFMGSFYTPYADILSGEGLFKIQSDAIRKLAESESCVIVGRCADYVLRDDECCVSFFIHDRLENRIQRIADRLAVTAGQALELITKTDKSRAAYYNYYTSKTWGVSCSYHFSVDASWLGIDETVFFLKALIERKFALA
jgi:cytidylate kinase